METDKEDTTKSFYELDICRTTITYGFNDPSTFTWFGDYIRLSESSFCDICLSLKYISDNRRLADPSSSFSFLEFQAVMLATGNYLLCQKRALFHSVSFIWEGLAWLLTAPSGTGKTTQLMNWMKMYGSDTLIINGDKTGLECRGDGAVYAYSTPWMGKENIGFRNRSAKLGGIILLEQGHSNNISRLRPEKAVRPLFIEFISYPETEQQIIGQRDVLEQMIGTVPVWKAVNLGDESSTVLIHEALAEFITGKEHSTRGGPL